MAALGNSPSVTGEGDGHSGIPESAVLDYGVNREDMGEGYEAGEPWDASPDFGVPEFVQLIRDELNMVREAISRINDEEYGMLAGTPSRGAINSFERQDPIRQMQFRDARDALWKEEARLREALEDAIWLLEPIMEPPHNFPSQEKAKKMLHEGRANGRPLSTKQKHLFGMIAGGKRPTKVKK